jgi:hypothetical protein
MADPPRSERVAAWAAGVVCLSLASIVYPKLGLPAAFLTFIAVLALPDKARPSPRLNGALLCAGLASCAGLLLFIVKEAVPGIVQGGRNAVEAKAVSRLRAIVSAQDALRRLAAVDPDHDGVGSAALIGELCGRVPLRGERPLDPPPFACGDAAPSTLGPADGAGAYVHVVCLPRLGGGWTAEPGVGVDEELAERRYLAYAWPRATSDFKRAFFSDEHERILEKSLPESGAGPGRELRCDAAITETGWTPWMGKQPRPNLPGDHGS